MEEVIAAIVKGEFGEALVRLWKMADLATLGDWENTCSKAKRKKDAAEFKAALDDESPISLVDANSSPLGLIEALDEHHAQARAARRRWRRPAR